MQPTIGEHNTIRGVQSLERADEQDVRLAIFPELAFLRFFQQRPRREQPPTWAEPIPGPTTDRFAINMFKKILMTTALVVLIGVLVIGAVDRTLAKNDSTSVSEGQGENWRDSDPALAASEQTSVATTQGQGNGGKGHGQGVGNEGAGESAYLLQAVPSDLSADESAALLFMREEEKLAHDVYAVFYTQWGLPVFQNISQSEQTHTESVQALLDSYGLADPASSELGVFTDPNLQALYNDLVARGSQSLAEAIKVGAAIEEMDILDLEERLAQTDNADIQQVFSNLMKLPVCHLASPTGSRGSPGRT